MRFSERIGAQPVRKVIQRDSMDAPLRNSLWNVLSVFYWNTVSNSSFNCSYPDQEFEDFLSHIWINYFKLPINEIPQRWKPDGYFFGDTIHDKLFTYFFECEWYEAYDFIEFVPKSHMIIYRDENINNEFRCHCNEIFECELSPYRFVGNTLTQITSEEEIQSIEEALESSDKFKPTAQHIKCALEKFANRSNPDYRNSIKESISAVEAMCKLVTGDEKATLTDAIKKIKGIHPALAKGFSQIYGYTSDAGGIRHAFLSGEKPKSKDAKFMLVACSAFINYLKAKHSV